MASVEFKRYCGSFRAGSALVNRILEELFPFATYWANARKLRRKSDELIDSGNAGLEAEYQVLGLDKLLTRLKEEHDRAIAIDEKTTKLTLTFSIAIALVSSIGSYFLDALEGSSALSAIVGLTQVAAIFALASGLIAVRALTTLPKYGYGTKFALEETNLVAVTRALMAQEKINVLRHVRNEAAYQCLRNALVCLVFAVILLCVEPWLGKLIPEQRVPRGRWAPSNNTLQVTFDPLRTFAVAKANAASNASERGVSHSISEPS